MKHATVLMVLVGWMALGVVGAVAGEDSSVGVAAKSAEGDATSAEDHIPQTVCPVMGGAIDEEVYSDYDGKRVYFCCPPCRDKFAEDPEGYIKKMESQGITLEKVLQPQTHCPITGKKIDKEFYVDHEGLRIYACCASCIKTIASDPSVAIRELQEQGVTLEALPGGEAEGMPESEVHEGHNHSEGETGERQHH